MSTTAKKKKKEKRNRNRKRRNQVNDAPNVLTFTCVLALPGRPILSGMRKIKKEKKKRKEGGRHTGWSASYCWQFDAGSLFVRQRGWLAARRNRGRGCMRCGCRWLSSSSRLCDGVAASASGQARVGAHKGGVRMRVERARKRTGLWKKKKKR